MITVVAAVYEVAFVLLQVDIFNYAILLNFSVIATALLSPF